MGFEHGRVVAAFPGVLLQAVSSRTLENARRLAARLAIPDVYSSVDSMLDKGRLDGVIVAVSHDHTVSVAEQVLARSIPCLVEKPVGFYPGDARRLAELASTNGCINMVAVNRRFYSTVLDALVAVLSMGPLSGFSVEAPEPIDHRRMQSSLPAFVYDHWLAANTIHAIDLIRMLGGEVVSLKGFRQRRLEPSGDGFAYSAFMSNGSLASFTSQWNSPGVFSLRLYGHGVQATLAPLERALVRFHHGDQMDFAPSKWDTAFKPGLYRQAQCFFRAVFEQRRPSFPASDLADHARSLALVQDMLAQDSVSEPQLL